MNIATFGAGCFWGVEEKFRQIKGVLDTEVGYMGGNKKNPTYEEVCTDQTGHAEVVQVKYDPDKVSYEQLVNTFFDVHDPTTKNQQGPDIGTQYRSVVFFHQSAQQEIATYVRKKLGKSGKFTKPIVTEIVPASIFYRAEEYHQQYLQKRGQRSCHI